MNNMNMIFISGINAMRIGVYAMIPLMNIMFILFIHYTQPTI